MKKLYIFLVLGISLLVIPNLSFSQCTPDPTCNDVLDPGEICPEILPDGTVGVAYSETITIIPPATAILDSSSGSSVTIKKIKISDVGNLPPGLTYQCNPANCEFTPTNPITRYCVLLSGTPTTSGVYPLRITIIPYISVGGFPVPSTPVVDSTSLSVTINSAVSVSLNNNKINNIDPKPNPFVHSTQLGFVASKTTMYELNIYDIVGNKLYNEKKMAVKGENYFEYTGSKLAKGVYIYSIQNGNEIITKQLVKQ